MSEMDFYQLGVSASTIEIPLTQGKTALIDVEDYELVSQYKWHTKEDDDRLYALHTINLSNGRVTGISMHRLILNAKNGEKVDHINGNGLNNRRCNLRIVTDSQNSMNRRKYKNSTSKYKGVSWYKRYNKWLSCIESNKKNLTLGYFLKEEDAARAYDKKAKELFGEYARLNFPLEMK